MGILVFTFSLNILHVVVVHCGLIPENVVTMVSVGPLPLHLLVPWSNRPMSGSRESDAAANHIRTPESQHTHTFLTEKNFSLMAAELCVIMFYIKRYKPMRPKENFF